ncbi:MAG: lipid-A-disaccharide synthase, partial [Bacteroidetes bacterium]
MKYYLIAGEASGDLHGANLARALKKADPMARFRFWGGDEMAAILGPPRKHIKDLAFMGFWEVVKNLPAILANFRFCRADIRDFQPDVLILIDYPGFNLRMAKWAKKAGIRVFYYISPQLWAWHSSRAKTVRDCVDEMFVILPFEKDFYKKYDLDVHFVGHPLLDVTEHFRASENLRLFAPTAPFSEAVAADTPKEKRIALLPGSRRQEIRNMLPVMLEVAMQFPDYQFVVAEAPAMDSAVYARIFEDFFARHGHLPHLKTTRNQTRLLLAHSTAALVTSGTATLETALFEVPQVVCYKGNGLS